LPIPLAVGELRNILFDFQFPQIFGAPLEYLLLVF